jgi:hypothetical protein
MNPQQASAIRAEQLVQAEAARAAAAAAAEEDARRDAAAAAAAEAARQQVGGSCRAGLGKAAGAEALKGLRSTPP